MKYLSVRTLLRILNTPPALLQSEHERFVGITVKILCPSPKVLSWSGCGRKRGVSGMAGGGVGHCGATVAADPPLATTTDTNGTAAAGWAAVRRERAVAATTAAAACMCEDSGGSGCSDDQGRCRCSGCDCCGGRSVGLTLCS